jgi:hypothetical protein
MLKASRPLRPRPAWCRSDLAASARRQSRLTNTHQRRTKIHLFQPRELGLLETMGILLVEGREFTDLDTTERPDGDRQRRSPAGISPDAVRSGSHPSRLWRLEIVGVARDGATATSPKPASVFVCRDAADVSRRRRATCEDRRRSSRWCRHCTRSFDRSTPTCRCSTYGPSPSTSKSPCSCSA